MSGRHLSVLVAAAILALITAFWASSVREPAPGSAAGIGSDLLPGLADAANGLQRVRLVGAGNESIATLVRADGYWALEEKQGYRANVGELRTLLQKLSEAKLLEEKTSNPAYYERLGVEPVGEADAGGIRVELGGGEFPAVILGDQVATRDAMYARLADEEKSWLVSGGHFVPRETGLWLDTSLLDVDAARIAEVEILHPDGERVVVSKSEFGQADFEVEGIPAGRELQRNNVANPVGAVLQNFSFDDVFAASDGVMSDEGLTRTVYRAFDGLEIAVESQARDDKYYARISAGTNAAVAARYLPEPETDAETGGESTDVPAPVTPSVPDLTAVAAEAESLNDRFDGWVYEVPKFKFDYLNRRMADLLKAAE